MISVFPAKRSVMENARLSNNSSLQERTEFNAPDFSNLEIRGVWNGDPNDAVDLKISLEVSAHETLQSCPDH